jgi:hypothetical protein
VKTRAALKYKSLAKSFGKLPRMSSAKVRNLLFKKCAKSVLDLPVKPLKVRVSIRIPKKCVITNHGC